VSKRNDGASSWRNRIVGEAEVSPSDLLANPLNYRVHPRNQVDALAGILGEVGWVQRVIVNRETGHIVDGHARVGLAISRKEPTVPVVYVDLTDAEEKLVLATLDPISAMATADKAILDQLLADVSTGDAALQELIAKTAEAATIDTAEPMTREKSVGNIADRFLIAPFTVLNAREGWWQERKRAWLSLGIKSELGRDAAISGAPLPLDRANSKVSPGGSPRPATDYGVSNARGDGSGRRITTAPPGKPAHGSTPPHGGNVTRNPDGTLHYTETTGTSVFDPVLTELIYRWFCAPGHHVLDPFAGGSVRGIVASKLGRRYTGVELRANQVMANRGQADVVLGVDDIQPSWIIGDSQSIMETCADVSADLIFSCPPYADLEIYSDDPADLSAMTYEDFLTAYRAIIENSCKLLKPDRFACFVVGDVRDKQGNYRNFVGDTVQAFRDAGLHLYNEAILVTAVGSLPIRIGKQFSATRKMGKTHQNVLVFLKGDARAAAEACGVVDVTVPDFADDEVDQPDSRPWGERL